MEVRSSNVSSVPPLYSNIDYINVDSRRKHLKERRSILQLKSDNRAYALGQLEEVKQKVIQRSWKMFEEKNEDARKVSTQAKIRTHERRLCPQHSNMAQGSCKEEEALGD